MDLNTLLTLNAIAAVERALEESRVNKALEESNRLAQYVYDHECRAETRERSLMLSEDMNHPWR